ncbi:hypothetical protein CB0940_07910 [Cercospora beticola]|uniref:Uncharacterized protein n=1 Tax=Cercospora beticola TaxID=122368 RepID=A0A2G5HAE3_CERBT|nr:hypothetical protein CB0940_07910 [Cercospora beticola]PIA89498.1 hypothetical protein CB0940_07910 [Cercospora beticola]WPB03880.1 hypothetical protein RHO25_008524 [Cercospora beticola]CAK1357341.1 unnamed protein product [Cercospora beticola]
MLSRSSWQATNAMANQVPSNSVWSAMSYQPPRGGCNYKTSILSSCPCLRFMLHPVKAATSFDCDGCGHHASFHSLENVAEDAILKKWTTEQGSARGDVTASDGSKKRRRIAEKPNDDVQILELSDDVFPKTTPKPGRARPSRKDPSTTG